jgi:membrane-associated phospholipid phosphatase
MITIHADCNVRSSEWVVAGFFIYVAVLSTCFATWFLEPRDPTVWKTWALAAVIVGIIQILTRFPKRGQSYSRDLAPIAYTLAAYREMDWFTPSVHAHRLERAWIVWDRRILDGGHLRAAIESTGALLPGFLELCYGLVYAVALVSLIAIFASRCRDRVNLFWLAYLVGTLGAYALFPYFPSEPPRTAFPGADMPRVTTAIREFNLFIVGGYGIHSSVFPSAHVSSALSAAWGLLAAIPKRQWIGWLMFAYGIVVAVATVYGRYHYAADGLAGIAVSLAALAVLRLTVTEPRP